VSETTLIKTKGPSSWSGGGLSDDGPFQARYALGAFIRHPAGSSSMKEKPATGTTTWTTRGRPGPSGTASEHVTIKSNAVDSI
jgi:hypothetical protein